MGLERGGMLHHLHCQAVIRVAATNAANVTKNIKRFLGWTKNNPARPAGAVVSSKKLTGKRLHTWLGMLGYVTKDQGKDHYELVATDDITPEDFEEGRRQYLLMGAGDLKFRCSLTPRNLLPKAIHFKTFHMRDRFNRNCLAYVLLKMLRSGNYFACPSWVTKYQGGGMQYVRADALWRTMCEPKTITLDDVKDIFFHEDEYHRNRYFHPR
jgi:hypothetical protein